MTDLHLYVDDVHMATVPLPFMIPGDSASIDNQRGQVFYVQAMPDDEDTDGVIRVIRRDVSQATINDIFIVS